ncbi:hypothetical protein WJX74_007753 [Apatococcus lobatus]|uniref:UspA domain-containing protein n=1 Tax=Apatococcus lobatus TaxID=904363 RepID=A0AAW1RQD5_9CHLO
MVVPKASKSVCVLAVDDSEASERAVVWALTNLDGKDHHYRLTHIVQEPINIQDPRVVEYHADKSLTDKAASFLRERFAPLLQQAGVTFDIDVILRPEKDQNIGFALCKRCSEVHAETVVMGRHHKWPGFLVYLHDSVSMHVAQQYSEGAVVLLG